MPSYNHLKTQNFSVLLLLYCLVGQLCLTVSLWAPACQSSLSFTISQSLLKLMSAESVIPSNRFFLCCPLLLLPSIFPSIRVFSDGLALHIRWPKYWSFSFNISPCNDFSGLIFFWIGQFDLLAVQGTLKSLFQQHRLKASVHRCSVFFMVQFSNPYMTTRKTIALIIWTFVGKVMPLFINMLSRFVITSLSKAIALGFFNL